MIKKIYGLFFLSIFLFSCAGDENKIVIVDVNGNPVKGLKKMVPKFNEEQLARQKAAFKKQGSDANKFQQNLATGGDDTFISAQGNNSSRYPDDIFADRITNYNNGNSNIIRNSKNVKASTTGEVVEKGYTAKKTSKGGPYYIQVGVYSTQKNADAAYNKFKHINTGKVDKYAVKGITKYKVTLGGYPDKASAEKDMEKIIKTGHYDVYVAKQK